MLSGKYWPQPGKERAYLYRCVWNLCYDELRRRKRISGEEKEAVDASDRYLYLELIAPLSDKDRQHHGPYRTGNKETISESH